MNLFLGLQNTMRLGLQSTLADDGAGHQMRNYRIAWLRAGKLRTYDREATDSELKSSKPIRSLEHLDTRSYAIAWLRAGKLKTYDREAKDSELESSRSIRSPGSELESSKPTTAKQGTLS